MSQHSVSHATIAHDSLISTELMKDLSEQMKKKKMINNSTTYINEDGKIPKDRATIIETIKMDECTLIVRLSNGTMYLYNTCAALEVGWRKLPRVPNT